MRKTNRPMTNDKMVYFKWNKSYGKGRSFAFEPGDIVRVKEGRLMNKLGGVMALKNTQPPMYVVAFKDCVRMYRPVKLDKVTL